MKISIKKWIYGVFVRLESLTVKWMLRIAAAILITLGIVTFPLPLPIGLILIIVGLAMLISSSKQLSFLVKKLRNQNSGLNNSLEKFKRYVPATIRRILEKTDPE